MIIKEFSYLNEIIKDVSKGKPFPVLRINCIGGRMGAKTINLGLMLVVICLLKKTKIDMFRWTKGKDKLELWDQIIAIIDFFPNLLEKCEIHLTRFTITFPNGSIIEVGGLRVRGSNEVKLTGKSGSNKFEYHIALAEERYEISDSAWGDVLQAIRGTKNFMEIHLANPWIFTNDYVKHCNDNLPFNLQQLKTNHKQFLCKEQEIKMSDGSIYKYKEIFHYTNYLVNDKLALIDKVKLEQAAKHDPHRANTILYGYPGTPKGSIWKWVLPQMKQTPRDPSIIFIGGVDYGERADPTAAYIIGFNSGISHSHIEHEYYWRNNDFGVNKDTQALAEDVVNHFLDFMEDRMGNSSSLEIYVDGSAIPFITALNTYTDSLGYSSSLKFYQQTNKGRVADRIETMKTLASFGIISVDENCKELLRELNEQTYSDKSRTSIDYVDGDDHGTDAIYYGLVVKWIELLEHKKYLIEDEAQKTLEEMKGSK